MRKLDNTFKSNSVIIISHTIDVVYFKRRFDNLINRQKSFMLLYMISVGGQSFEIRHPFPVSSKQLHSAFHAKMHLNIPRHVSACVPHFCKKGALTLT